MDEIQPWTSDKPKSIPKGFPFLTKLVSIGRFAIWWQPGGIKRWRLSGPHPCIGIDWEIQVGPFIFRWNAPDHDECKAEDHKPIYFVSEERTRKRGCDLEDYHTCRCRCVQYFGHDTLEDAVYHWETSSVPTLVIESIEYLGPKGDE